MEHSFCTLSSRIWNVHARSQRRPQHVSSFSDKDALRSIRRCVSVRNSSGELFNTRNNERDPTITVHKYLRVAIHRIYRNRHPSELSVTKNHLIAYVEHVYQPAISCLAGMGSHTCNLYQIVSFDKFHIMDPDKRQFCDLRNTEVQRDSSISLSCLITIESGRYSSPPNSHPLYGRTPIRSTQQDSQAGISSKIRP